ncbi:MAG: beta-N-acetylhexosaminidase [Paracoccaceae bacterium]
MALNRQAVGQGATILGCAGLTLSPQEARFFQQADPWGFILFARNVESPDQLRALCADLRAAIGRDAPILIDQEGGRVQRLTPPTWRQYLPPLEQVQACGAHAARSMYLRSVLIADEMQALGIDVNCAPTADIAGPQTHPFLHNRCYGTDAQNVIKMGRAVVDGMAARGVMSVLKHIPGHGRATADSHLDLPHVTVDAQTLRETDFAPFKGLNDLPMAMTAHIVYEALDPEHCATQSKIMIETIRDEIGFHGLLMTDDISMQALSGSLKHRAESSIKAGCDIVLHCNGKLAEMDAAVAGAGRLTAQAQARADRVIASRPAPQAIDIPAVEAELYALLNG